MHAVFPMKITQLKVVTALIMLSITGEMIIQFSGQGDSPCEHKAVY